MGLAQLALLFDCDSIRCNATDCNRVFAASASEFVSALRHHDWYVGEETPDGRPVWCLCPTHRPGARVPF